MQVLIKLVMFGVSLSESILRELSRKQASSNHSLVRIGKVKRRESIVAANQLT
jgi:hypothetical protein